MEPTKEDAARDLRADLARHEGMQREVGIGLAFGVHTLASGYADDVYEYAKFALEAMPAALRWAIHAEDEVAAAKKQARRKGRIDACRVINEMASRFPRSANEMYECVRLIEKMEDRP